ncbi:MAG: hypothetical protein VYA67_21875 [Actinomycetota bacterium]|nr:hypothetical protein [Actinomycetota bacterium]
MKFTVSDALIWFGVAGTSLLVVGAAIGAFIGYRIEHHHRNGQR